ncbi:hypothetical protein O6P43_017793 [Quillaja saponaria]|uniref:C2H2-type domain-containing protein n=1 Tax=Quillaja saponaria TaxID=32244 RepID=A0AAD7LT49_QUISA|nr:hypothetical protein O6P43_017793 [Quillaja saponaria]
MLRSLPVLLPSLVYLGTSHCRSLTIVSSFRSTGRHRNNQQSCPRQVKFEWHPKWKLYLVVVTNVCGIRRNDWSEIEHCSCDICRRKYTDHFIVQSHLVHLSRNYPWQS